MGGLAGKPGGRTRSLSRFPGRGRQRDRLRLRGARAGPSQDLRIGRCSGPGTPRARSRDRARRVRRSHRPVRMRQVHAAASRRWPRHAHRRRGRDRGGVLRGLDENALARMRRRHIGVVFQFFNLLDDMSALENVVLPAVIAGATRRRAESRARDLLDLLGLGEKAARGSECALGRQRQRLAIARALANEPTCSSPMSRPVRWTPTAGPRSSSCYVACRAAQTSLARRRGRRGSAGRVVTA